MDYIVFDLEWNQSPDGKKYADSRLPFEIIEIGAVKLNEQREVVDTFQRLIKPQVYNWIHDSIHEVIHVDYKDLADGQPFAQAAGEFLKWCGRDYIFCTWGNQDVMELQRNMKYYGILSLLPGPVTYYDVQKIYGICYEEGDERRSLESAIDQMGIPKALDFHRALTDARYTGEILKKLDLSAVRTNFSIDVYQNPKSRKDEVFISYPTYDKYVSREFTDKEKVMKDREVASTRCPVCHMPAKRMIRWFVNNSRVYESVSFCQKHGYIKGKVRIRHTDEDAYYAIKTLMKIEEKNAEEIRDKRDSLRRKRQAKRQSDKLSR